MGLIANLHRGSCILCTLCTQSTKGTVVALLFMRNVITIKARARYGTESMDLTVPVQIRREFSINPGDIFLVEANKDKDGSVIITYKRVFCSPSR